LLHQLFRPLDVPLLRALVTTTQQHNEGNGRFGSKADFLQISLENKNPRLRLPGASGISNAEGSRHFEYAPEKLGKS
jgi:hypothetical protein